MTADCLYSYWLINVFLFFYLNDLQYLPVLARQCIQPITYLCTGIIYFDRLSSSNTAIVIHNSRLLVHNK